jgi:nitrite reductase/ring-hydroxylating ferredoxin subunit
VTDPLISRRRALAGTAVGGLALPLLAACGSGGTSDATADDPANDPANDPVNDPATDSSGAGNDDGGGTGQTPADDALVATADVPVGGGVVLASRNVVVTQPTKGRFQGFSATCTHQGCILATVSAGTINCACHGSQFSITDGSNVAGPSGSTAGSVAALPKVAVKVEGAEVVPG